MVLPAYAVNPPWLSGPYLSFIQAERQNSFVAEDSEVNADFLAQSKKVFDVPYLFIPAEDLHVELAKGFQKQISSHLIVKKNGKSFVRFFIHPESLELYDKLVKKYGVAGFYQAVATSSSRTVLAADPTRPNVPPVFLKLSLAKLHGNLGRVIPAWEVRRSVRNTEQLVSSAEIDSLANAHIISEFAGVYIDKKEELGFRIDADQGTVFEHGFILRDASFIEQYKNYSVVPLFHFFSSHNGAPPLIVSYWKKARETNSRLTFMDYLSQALIQPFIRMNLPLMVRHGVFPQIHGQNILLGLDKKTKQIKHIFHRDIGSFKTDYRLRWISEHPIDSLRSELADKDFGLSWAAEKLWPYYHDYFFQWNIYTYENDIRAFYKPLRVEEIEAAIRKTLKEELADYLGLPHNNSVELTPSGFLLNWIDHNPPAEIKNESAFSIKASDIALWLAEKREKNQVVKMPGGWNKKLSDWLGDRMGAPTEYGYVFKYIAGGRFIFFIAFYDQDDVRGGRAALPVCEALMNKAG